MTDIASEILLGLRALGLDYRASENGLDGPWRANCPECFTLWGRDVFSLTVSGSGHLRCSNGCDVAKIAEAIGSAAEGQPPAQPLQPTSWAPVDLAPVLAGGHFEAAPSILRRTDGRCLLYPGRAHALHAEPEALKTWLALLGAVDCLRDFQNVVYIDFEDNAASIVDRLLSLGAEPEAIATGFVYVRPDEPLANAAVVDLDRALQCQPALAVIDGVTEALSQQGLSLLDNSDVAKWLGLLPRRLARTGAAVLLLDHVVKSREERGRYAIGAQHKLAGVDVAYSLRVLEPFARGREGQVAIKVEKDRPGRVREYAENGQVAILRASSDGDSVRIVLEPPEPSTSFRPTVLMERASLAIEADPGLSKRAIRETVRGKSAICDLALQLLVAEGFVDARRDAGASRHYSVKPYREIADATHRDPVTLRDPTVTPDTGEDKRDPVTPPLQGSRSRGHASQPRLDSEVAV